MSEILSLSISIQSISTMADRSIKLTAYTQELPPADMTRLFEFNQKQCFALLGENEIQNIPKELNEKLGQKAPTGKSPSQIFRNVLYIYREQNKPVSNFDDYYNSEMNKVIEHYKQKLL